MANKLTDKQIAVLKALADGGELKAETWINSPESYSLNDKHTDGRTVHALTKRGMLKRKQSAYEPGYACYGYTLTDAGRAAIAAEQQASAPDVPAPGAGYYVEHELQRDIKALEVAANRITALPVIADPAAELATVTAERDALAARVGELIAALKRADREIARLRKSLDFEAGYAKYLENKHSDES